MVKAKKLLVFYSKDKDKTISLAKALTESMKNNEAEMKASFELPAETWDRVIKKVEKELKSIPTEEEIKQKKITFGSKPKYDNLERFNEFLNPEKKQEIQEFMIYSITWVVAK
jgi:hypothetical protein